MKTELSVFLPTRKGSERVPNKNTKDFAGIKNGLLGIKLNQLNRTPGVGEIVLSSNDPNSLEIGTLLAQTENRIKVIERPDNLALSSTSLIDLVKYVPSICSLNHILWTHVTSPFCDELAYELAIKIYWQELEKGSDSLMSGKRFQNFLWDNQKHDLVNRVNHEKWPRTQDLAPWFEINSAVFIASKEIYQTHKDRIGQRPFLLEQSTLQSFDIDWPDDFKMAEFLYKERV
ncbi:MAG: acylneuraminate cytidylyltransferase family protein [Bacteroidia bacterium]|nr:acylneuraminate cytidylyltransferase family protein [Bacteroidia bacterium]